MKTTLLKVSTVIYMKGDFSNCSDNITVCDNHIMIGDTLCEVTMEELSWEKDQLEIYANIPVEADSVEEAELLAAQIVEGAVIDPITLLDNTTNQIHTIKVEEFKINEPEYFN